MLPNKLYCIECPFCGKEICGINVRQTEYNARIHMLYCKKRKEMKKEVDVQLSQGQM